MLVPSASPPRTRAGAEIVDAILGAAALLLERDGIDGLNTNVVARVAGVSIGSVYKYFPDKHAIVAELARRQERIGLGLVMTRMGSLATAGTREILAELIDLVLGPALGGLGFRRTLLVEVPRVWTRLASENSDATFGVALEGLLRARPQEVRSGPYPEMAFASQHAVEGVIEIAVLKRPALLSSARFAAELNHLTWRYLSADWQPPREPARAPQPIPPSPPSDPRLQQRFERERSRRPTPTPAPEPANARGRAAVDRILEAVTRVLAAGGIDALSIRSIAREAGIAPSAVYRHFTTKEAVVAELGRRLESRIVASLASRISAFEARSAAELARAVVQLVATSELGELSVRRTVREQVPPRWMEAALIAKLDAMEKMVRAALGARANELRTGDLDLMSFVVTHAVDAVVQAAVLRRRNWIESGTLVDELSRLAYAFVSPCEQPPGAPSILQ